MTVDEPSYELRTLFHERYGQLVALADVVLRNRMDAEDVVQDAFAAAVRRGTAITGDPSGYVVQSVVNGARSRLRRRSSERRPRPLRHRPTAVDTDGELFELVRRLPKRQAQAILCRFVLDQTFEDVARSLGISRRAARTHVDRGIRTLKTWIEESST